MPFMKCTKNGKSGVKWGASGTCYLGATGRKRANAQRVAIGISQGVYKPKKKRK